MFTSQDVKRKNTFYIPTACFFLFDDRHAIPLGAYVSVRVLSGAIICWEELRRNRASFFLDFPSLYSHYATESLLQW